MILNTLRMGGGVKNVDTQGDGYEAMRVHRSYAQRSFQCFSMINLIFFYSLYLGRQNKTLIVTN